MRVGFPPDISLSLCGFFSEKTQWFYTPEGGGSPGYCVGALSVHLTWAPELPVRVIAEAKETHLVKI